MVSRIDRLTSINPLAVDMNRLRQTVDRSLEVFETHCAADQASMSHSIQLHFTWTFMIAKWTTERCIHLFDDLLLWGRLHCLLPSVHLVEVLVLNALVIVTYQGVHHCINVCCPLLLLICRWSGKGKIINCLVCQHICMICLLYLYWCYEIVQNRALNITTVNCKNLRNTLGDQTINTHFHINILFVHHDTLNLERLVTGNACIINHKIIAWCHMICRCLSTRCHNVPIKWHHKRP